MFLLKKLKFVHKIIHNNLPSYFQTYWEHLTKSVVNYNLRSRILPVGVLRILYYFLYYTCAGRPQDLAGGGRARIFFSRFGNLHVAKRHAAHGEAKPCALLGGFGGMPPPREIFFKMVQFGALSCIF